MHVCFLLYWFRYMCKKRHVVVVVVDGYHMCKGDGESVDHHLFHFEVACALWNVFFSRFGLS
jgi:hypothetical protein